MHSSVGQLSAFRYSSYLYKLKYCAKDKNMFTLNMRLKLHKIVVNYPLVHLEKIQTTEIGTERDRYK